MCRLGRASCPGVPCNVFSGVQTYSWYAQRDTLRLFKPGLTPFCCAGLHGLAAACSAPIVDRGGITVARGALESREAPEQANARRSAFTARPGPLRLHSPADRGSFRTFGIADRHTGALHGFAKCAQRCSRLNWAARQVISRSGNISSIEKSARAQRLPADRHRCCRRLRCRCSTRTLHLWPAFAVAGA